MTTDVLICDDSDMARKQMARALPGDWDLNVRTAVDGQDCLNQLRQGHSELLFLDLNMPVMDGYQVLETIRREDLPVLVIVVSADIQPDARRRVLSLGALGFVKKPLDPNELAHVLIESGFYRPDEAPGTAANRHSPSPVDNPVDGLNGQWRDALQEVANVAMGQAGDHLARLLNVFVQLPVPRVTELAVSDLRMALASAQNGDSEAAVGQGFIGGGITGEAILLFSDSALSDMAQLVGFGRDPDDHQAQEVLGDMTSVLAGAFLKGLSDQLNTRFSVSPPAILGHQISIAELIEQNRHRWTRMLAIELNYRIDCHGIRCDLLLLMTEESLTPLQQKLAFLME